jgi:predicted phosphodiesterase
MLVAAAVVAEAPNLPDRAPVSKAVWPTDALKFRFAVIGDRTGGGENEWPLFDRAMDEINLLRPDFAIMIGDAIQGYTQDPSKIASEWEDFHTHAGKLQAPLFLVAGNHDVSTPDMLRWWQEHIGRTYYSFDYRACHFLVLNTQEHWIQNESSIGPDQVCFVLDDLDHSKTARHTFVFMHIPLWNDPNHAEWREIEAALAGRPHTVFAGHTHRLTFEKRGETKYLVVATTRGIELPRSEEMIPQMGLFPHFTEVTVEGGVAHLAIIEPGGPMWPEDIAPREFQESARKLVTVDALLPKELDHGEIQAGISVSLTNGLPETAEVTIEVSPTGPDGWRPVAGDASQTLALSPGTATTADALFNVPASRVVPVPRLQVSARYGGKLLQRVERNMPLFPESALRHIPEWEVVGPFGAGVVPNALPDKPREAMPEVFLQRGPEKGYVEGATFQDQGKSLSWQVLKTEAGFANLALCETPTHVLAYASCAMHSPAAKTVYAEFRADDYGQILVNGAAIENDRLFRTRSDATYVALPL